MRYLLLALILPASLGGCATGYATDWFRDRPSIINPQLLRFGMDVQQSRCVSERLGARLSRQQLRRLTDRAAAVRPPATGVAPFTLATLVGVANGTGDREIGLELANVAAGCGVTERPAPVLASGAVGGNATTGGPATSGGVPVDMTPITAGGVAAAGSTTWLNLGAADSGQSIAIDASSIQQEGVTRTAWFRMSDPERGGPSSNSYRLRINCEAKTVQPLAIRQAGEAGAAPSVRDYTPAEAVAGAAESGTVLEIAYLSLCT
jgi:hypothetical protein